jgi:hypothetical protein
MVAAVACDGTTTNEDASGTLPCAVDRVLESNCRLCHSDPPRYGAPMPLVTYGNLHAAARSTPSKKVYEMVHVRTHDANKPMPEPPQPALSQADLQILDDWIARGAPEGSACGGPTSKDGGPRDGSAPVEIHDPPPGCPNVTLEPSAPWAMPQSTGDEYVCFGVDVSLSKKRHITSFSPKVQNQTIAHHALIYLSDYSESSMPEPCSPASVVGRRLIYGWAPGGEPFELPPNVGLPIEGTAHFVVQMHYSNLQHLAGQTDKTAIELCTTEELRANDADVMAFGADDFTIPPRSTLEADCTFDVPSLVPPLHVFRSMPHMHQIGRTIGTSVQRPGQAPVVLDEVKNWSFGSQPWNAVDLTINPGDTVRSWCSWANGTEQPVSWGEKTSDEMCYHFVMYWPRINVPQWRWEAPIGLGTCTTK